MTNVECCCLRSATLHKLAGRDSVEPNRGPSGLIARPRGRLRKMLVREHNSDAHDHTQDETDDKAKAGGILQGSFTQVEDAGRFVFVHKRELPERPGLARARIGLNLVLFFR